MFFSYILCFKLCRQKKPPSMPLLWLQLRSLCGSLRAGKHQAKGGWRAQRSFFLQPGMTLHRVLWSQGCPRPLPSPPDGTQECCDCKVFCWLAQHEENFLGHELESQEVLCTSPPRRCYQHCPNTHASALPQRQATGAMEKGDVPAGPMPALCLGCDGFPLV